jgi:hypothetical protein
MLEQETNAEALALSALGWTLTDGDRAARLLALTGLTPEGLRASIGERSVLAATLGFLEAHEPDLVACAEALGIKPEELVRARERLEG